MKQDEIIEMAKTVRSSGYWDAFDLINFAKLVAEKEREACAKLCDDINAEYEAKDVFSSYAEAIRERGQT